MGYKRWTKSAAQLRADAKYGSRLASKFINCMMWDGKKAVAQRIFSDAMDRIERKIKDIPPIEIFEKAVDNVKPEIQIRSRRVGGSNYQVPMPVNAKRRQSLAIRWILDVTRSKKGRPMCESLATELVDAFNRQGGAMGKREDVHRQAEANKAFAHFAWGRGRR